MVAVAAAVVFVLFVRDDEEILGPCFRAHSFNLL